MLLLIFSAVLILLIFLYIKLKVPLQYWKEKGVPYVQPCLVLGNMAPVVFRTRSFGDVLQDAYAQFSGQRYLGFYQFSTPSLMIRDPDLVKQICIKDFDKFTDHTDFLPETSDPFWKKGLFAKEGKDWHDMRTILSPAFTGSKMRAMFGLMVECAEAFVNHFSKQSGTVTLEMKDTFTKFTNDVIASCAFGIQCDSLQHKNNEFFLMGKKAFDFTGFKSLKFFGTAISPTLMKFFQISLFDEKMKNFFRKIIRETIQYREKTKIIRPDMIHLLLEAQKGRLKADDDVWVTDTKYVIGNESKSYKRTEITDEDITVQAVLFFFAGYDTVSVLLCNMAYELALHPDVQQRLIKEVDDTLQSCNGKITYEALMGMRYLDMVTSEVLRIRTIALFINRKCVKPYTIEPVLPGEKRLEVEVGTDIMIPTSAIHMDSMNFLNPDTFDPERFNDQNKDKINPFTYFPFGVGPRICIGNRFALLETKTVIFYLLTKFEIVPVEKTQIPFIPCKKTIFALLQNGYWLGLKPRTLL